MRLCEVAEQQLKTVEDVTTWMHQHLMLGNNVATRHYSTVAMTNSGEFTVTGGIRINADALEGVHTIPFRITEMKSGDVHISMTERNHWSDLSFLPRELPNNLYVTGIPYGGYNDMPRVVGGNVYVTTASARIGDTETIHSLGSFPREIGECLRFNRIVFEKDSLKGIPKEISETVQFESCVFDIRALESVQHLKHDVIMTRCSVRYDDPMTVQVVRGTNLETWGRISSFEHIYQSAVVKKGLVR